MLIAAALPVRYSIDAGLVSPIVRVTLTMLPGTALMGIAKASRDWRIASPVLMPAAVGKVFLLATLGLEGLLRIGSFLALGFSLIGIGWLDSRYLRPVE